MQLKWSEHARKRTAQGALAACGAPAGWLVIEWCSGVDPLTSLGAQPGLYAYMLFGTTLVLATFGFYVGNYEANLLGLAARDPLTGAYNRRHFEARLQDELVRFRRTHQPIALASLDIDHFKRINDHYGHAAGDEVLKQLVGKVGGIIRAVDEFARVGGEEFLILMPATSQEDAAHAMTRLLTAIRQQTIQIDSQNDVNITISIGLTLARDDDDPASLLMRADQAMYRAKETGRDRLVAG